ncbi:UvrD-helicase domain-containing protein [Paenibacillus sp. B01]|uniref:UvrD-helicase domain-containing protein n=1 Tax=Paenibacillus sp. B01 TaxID=2660554 RepID=UPI00129A7592|nr:ATP-dependent helicase [Paenibacillus sp. B01]QGG55029.1 AAA family ATPase [Paenibacillus sp. B01]
MDGLNPEQQRIIDMEGNILVTACPGSGKTRTLTRKIAHELSTIERKKFLIALTFTNRAADEIQSRIDLMNIETSQLWTGTIHSFCLEWIIKPYAGYHDKTKNGFTVIDEHRQEALLSRLKEDYGLRYYDGVNTKFNRSGDVLNVTQSKRDIVIEYHNYLESNKLIDFDMILYIAFQILTERPQIAKTLSSLFPRIFVDEYQDTSDLQYGIIGKIVSCGNGITRVLFVGDPDQAIFDTLGGVAKSLGEIVEEIGGYSITHCNLSGNYRSSQRIIDLYRTFQLTDLEITALGETSRVQGEITLNDVVDVDSLTEEIASLINRSIQKGIPMNEICVIAPQWMLLIPMARRLKILLPHIDFDAPGLSPLPRRAENFWFKVARLFLTEPQPSLYMNRIRWANEVLREMNQFTGSPYDLEPRGLLKIINSIHSHQYDGELFLRESFSEFLQKLKIQLADHHLLEEHYNAFFNGLKQRLQKELSLSSLDISSFRTMFKQHKGVVVNTCQGVKGEEFTTVIAFGLLEGLIPHFSLRNNSQASEESSKKLLYVICSRAKKNLHLISEVGRKYNTEINKQLRDLNYNFDSIDI